MILTIAANSYIFKKSLLKETPERVFFLPEHVPVYTSISIAAHHHSDICVLRRKSPRKPRYCFHRHMEERKEGENRNEISDQGEIGIKKSKMKNQKRTQLMQLVLFLFVNHF